MTPHQLEQELVEEGYSFEEARELSENFGEGLKALQDSRREGGR